MIPFLLSQDSNDASKGAVKSTESKSDAHKQSDLSSGNSGGGWLNGILSKFSAKNRMKLPDDKDPKVNINYVLTIL